MSNYTKLLNNLDTLKLFKIKDNIDTYINLINDKEKNIVDDEYVYIRKNAFYNHIKDTKESQKLKNETFPQKL